jgi:large subunit ribosomal protein L15
MELNQLKDMPGARKKRMRVGRGIGSGKGKTCGRGGKGQTARSGVAIGGFEGGQMPLYQRLPKRGFKNPLALKFNEITLSRLQNALEAGKLQAGDAVDEALLVQTGVLRRTKNGLRLLATGHLNAKLNLTVRHASKAAVEAVEKAGGKVTILVPAEKETGRKKDGKAEQDAKLQEAE